MPTIETCHYIDLMRFFSGQEVEWVFASSPKANLRTDYDYPDTSFAQLCFDNGLVANVVDSHARSSERFAEGSFSPDESYATEEGEYMDPVYGHQFEYSLIGTQGALWVRMLSKQISVLEKVKSRSEEHTSELQSHSFISYAVFCLKKKKNKNKQT